ncbi:MAG: type II toxin-antitoxin system HicA family toxin [Pseudomonadota bacterium]
MPSPLYRAVCAELKKLGYIKTKGGKGSHEKWQCQDTGRTTIVPSSMKSRHTANAILKACGSRKKV